MEDLESVKHENHLKMATEDFYRNQEKSYRSSKAYGKMTKLYPVLLTSIKECQKEKLVND